MSRGSLTVLHRGDAVLAVLPVGPFAMNEYVVGCRATGEAVLVDSGGDPAPFLAWAAAEGLRVTALWQTHAHVDHVAGLAATRAALPTAPIHLHPADRPLYDHAPVSAQMFGFTCPPPPAPDVALADGQVLALGSLRFEVLHTPGHAPGHVCFWERGQQLLLAGDLLFKDSIGRTDLPFCDNRAMRASLARVLELPDPTRVFAGHMEDTSIGRERAHNPVLRMLGL